MSYSVYGGTRNSLVFPVMCDAHVLVEYSKHQNYQDIGLWNDMKSFTMQAIITPYDVNGFGDNTAQTSLVDTANAGNGNVSSRKTMPATADSVANPENRIDQKYLPTANRYSHEMYLFHNENMTVSLVNKTTFNQNNPAEYSIKFRLRINSVDVTIESPAVFTSRAYHYHDLSEIVGTLEKYEWYRRFLYRKNRIIGETVGVEPYSTSGFDYRGYIFSSNTTPASNNSFITIQALGSKPAVANGLHVGMTILDAQGNTMGTVAAISGTYLGTALSTTKFALNLTDTSYDFSTITNGDLLYQPPKREALYIQNSNHIAVAFDNATRRMTIFYNGVEVVSGKHTQTADFALGNNDIYIGKDASVSYPNDRHTQFMGEIHELAIVKDYSKTFASFYTILVPYKDLLLYYDFGEGAK